MQKIQSSHSNKLSFTNKLHSLKLQEPIEISKLSVILILTYQMIQYIALILKALVLIDSTLSSTYLYKELSDITDILTLRNFVQVENISQKNGFTFFAFSGYCLVLILCLTAFLYKIRTQNDEQTVFIPKFIKITSTIHQYILILPLFLITFDIFIQISNVQGNLQPIPIIILSVACLGIIASTFVSLIPQLWTTPIKFNSKLSTIGTIEIKIYNVLRIILGLIVMLIQDRAQKEYSTTFIQWVFSVFNILFLMSVVYTHLWNPSFFSTTIRKTQKIFYGVCLSMGVVHMGYLIVQNSIEHKNRIESALIICTVIAPIFIKIILLYQSRINQGIFDLLSSTSKMTNIKDSLKLNNLLLISIYKISKLSSKHMIVNGDDKKVQKNLLKELGIFNVQNNNQQQRSEYIKKYLLKIKDQLQSNNSNLTLVIADALLTQFQDMTEAYRTIAPILSKKAHSIYEKPYIGALVIRDKIQDSINKANFGNEIKKQVDLHTFMKAMEKYNKLDELINKQIDERKKFYAILVEDSPNFTNLIESSLNIQKLKKTTTTFWKQITEEQLQQYTPMVKMYGLFNLFVNHELHEGTELLNKYNNFELQGFQNQKFIENKSAYLAHSVVFLVDAQPKTIGQVLSCSVNSSKYIGIPAIDIIGKNISSIMPASIGFAHNSILSHHLDREGLKLLQPRIINGFIINKEGFLKQVEVVSTLYPSLDEGLLFWGMMRPMNARNEFMIVSQRGIIEGATELISKMTGIVNKEKVSFNSICNTSHFSSTRSKLLDNTNLNSSFSLQKSSDILNQETTKSLNDIQSFSQEPETKLHQFRVLDIISHHIPLQRLKNLQNVPTIYQTYVTTMTFKKISSNHGYFTIEIDLSPKSVQRLIENNPQQAILSPHNQQFSITRSISNQTNSKFQHVSKHTINQLTDDSYIDEPSENMDEGLYEEHKEQTITKQSSNTKRVKMSENVLQNQNQQSLNRKDTNPQLYMRWGIKKATTTSHTEINTRILDQNDSERNSSRGHLGDQKDDQNNKNMMHDDTEDSDSKFDDRASMLSIQSNKTEKTIEVTLEEILKKVPFKRFQLGRIPFIVTTLFFVTFLSSVFIIYQSGTNSINVIDNRIKAFSTSNSRLSDLSIISSRLTFLKRYEIINIPPTHIVQVTYIGRVKNESLIMLEHSYELERIINNLSQSEQKHFYRQNIRVYEKEYEKLPDGVDLLSNSFDATKRLVANLQQYVAHYQIIDSEIKKSTDDFVMANLYNDFWVVNEQISADLANTITEETDNIFNLNKLLLALTLTTACLAFVTLLIILIKSHFDSIQFMRSTINHSMNNKIDIYVKDLDFFVNFMNRKLCRQKGNAKQNAANNNNNNNGKQISIIITSRNTISRKNSQKSHSKRVEGGGFTHYKRGNDTALTISQSIGALLIFILLIVLSSLFVIVRRQFLDAAQEIKPHINDMKQFNGVNTKISKLLTKMSVYVVRNQTKVNSLPILETLDDDLLAVEQSVSLDRGYSEKGKSLLQWDLCSHPQKYVSFSASITPCETMFQSSLPKGLQIATYSFHNYASLFINTIKTLNNTELAFSALLSTSDYFDALVMVNEHIRRGTEHINAQLRDDLLAILNKGVDTTYRLFFVNLVVGLLLIVVIGNMMNRYLFKRRIEIASIIQVLPNEFLFENKNLRHFMLKQSKAFYTLVKKYSRFKYLDQINGQFEEVGN